MTPNFRAVTAIVFAALLGASPAFAEGDKIVTSTHDEASGDKAGHYVDFSYDCGEECYAATLWCNENGTLNAELAEVAPQNVSKVILQKDQSFPVTVGTKNFKLFVQELKFSQMSGAWEVESYAEFDSRDFYAAVPKAKTIVMKLGTDKVTLPVNKDVTGWAAACAK